MNEATALPSESRDSVAMANREQALRHVARLTSEPLGHFIDGSPTAGTGGQPIDVLDPSTGTTIGQVFAGTADDIDSAAAAARVAGSHAVTPNSIDDSVRPATTVAAVPIARPIDAVTTACWSTKRVIARGLAPSARRTPSSRVRRRTRYDIIP